MPPGKGHCAEGERDGVGAGDARLPARAGPPTGPGHGGHGEPSLPPPPSLTLSEDVAISARDHSLGLAITAGGGGGGGGGGGEWMTEEGPPGPGGSSPAAGCGPGADAPAG